VETLAGQSRDTKTDSFVLSRIQEGNLMGNHLLDALALGAGVVYGFYAPKATAAGERGLRALVRRVSRATGIGQNTASLKEQRVISVFAIKLENGNERLVAARLSGNGLTIVAQQDLPTGAGVETVGGQAQVDYTTRQLLERLRSSGIGQADQVLVDPRLQNQAGLMQDMATSTDLLATRSLQSGLARCNSAERDQLQRWLQSPDKPLPENHPLAELIQQRTASYSRAMPTNQASVATMVELGIALAANPPVVS
jgi:hypothetical protein